MMMCLNVFLALLQLQQGDGSGIICLNDFVVQCGLKEVRNVLILMICYVSSRNVSSFGDYWKDIVTLGTTSDLAPIPPSLSFFDNMFSNACFDYRERDLIIWGRGGGG